MSAGTLHAQAPPPGAPPYVPTPMPLVMEMLDMAGVGEGDVVYDLGSGDGRIVIAAAERGARGVGVEYAGWLVERSRILADSAGVAEQTRFIHQDVFEADVREATVVMLYMGAEFNRRLRPLLLEQLAPGARIVSHAFHMDEWAANRTATFGSGASRATMYLWVVPADVDGFWSLEVDGMDPMSLEFHQSFQAISGQARGTAERSARLVEGSLRGASIRFEIAGPTGDDGEPLLFDGHLENGRLSGTVRGGSGVEARRWRALRFTDPSQAPS
ncbi:MAG: SAM-dependent methyltransferase [Gemmatimonadota bacterium]